MPYSNWHNKVAAIWLGILLLAAVVLGNWWWQEKIRIQSDVLSLLPKQHQSASIADAKNHMGQWLNRQLFVMVSANDATSLQQSSDHVLKQFAASSLWQIPPPHDAQNMGQILFAHKNGLLSTEDQKLLQTGQYDALTEAALMQLASPAMPLHQELLEQDPLLLFPRYLMDLQKTQQSDVILLNGYPSRQLDGQYHQLITIHLTSSPFDIDYQQQTNIWLKHLQQHIQTHTSAKIHITGTLVYATAGTQSAEHEVSTIGLGSSLGIVLLVWFGFKSFRPLVTEFAAVTSGCLMAFLMTHWLFEEVHLMTTVFGASLIGASVDFSFYYLFMQTHQRHQNSWQVMHAMLPDLFIGLLTTLAAYVCLLLTPFPGLRQIAVFSMTGLSAAWLTSMLLLPYLKALDTERAERHLQFLAHWRQKFLQNVLWRWSVVGVVLVFAAICLPHLQSDDDVRSLQAINPDWQQQEMQIKKIFGTQQTGQYLVISGQNETQTAQHEAMALDALQQARTENILNNFQALGLFVPTKAIQQQTIDALSAIPKDVLKNYAQQSGLDENTVLSWQQKLTLPQSLLQTHHLSHHPAAILRVNAHTRVVMLNDIQDPIALKKLIATLPQATLVQPTEDLSDLFHTYRLQSSKQLLWGIFGLSILLALIYGYRSVFGLMAPVILALLMAFSLQAALSIPINLFSIMAAFLVLGIGVDYAIFYRHTEKRTPVVSYALFLCMVAAILGFGLLALSHTQAIQSFGLTVLLGVIFSYLFANILTQAAPDIDKRDF